MSSTRIASAAAAALLIVGLAAPAAAKPPATGLPECEVVLAEADTVWIADKEIEVGDVAGLLNGGIYLNYTDGGDVVVDIAADNPNLVISNKRGSLEMWVSGESVVGKDGDVSRTLTTLGAQGTGAYAGATINLGVSGIFYPEKGGSYQVTGTICPSAIQPQG